MVEVTHTAWRELLHKHGLLPVADILEKYGIASVIDVSEMKQDDFDALEALGLKPFVLMKIKRWSTSGGVTDVLPSSSTVPPQNFKAAPSKVDKPRKLALRHVEGRGSSKHKNGARRAKCLQPG